MLNALNKLWGALFVTGLQFPGAMIIGGLLGLQAFEMFWYRGNGCIRHYRGRASHDARNRVSGLLETSRIGLAALDWDRNHVGTGCSGVGR